MTAYGKVALKFVGPLEGAGAYVDFKHGTFLLK
jgi:hypothetical protein